MAAVAWPPDLFLALPNCAPNPRFKSWPSLPGGGGWLGRGILIRIGRRNPNPNQNQNENPIRPETRTKMPTPTTTETATSAETTTSLTATTAEGRRQSHLDEPLAPDLPNTGRPLSLAPIAAGSQINAGHLHPSLARQLQLVANPLNTNHRPLILAAPAARPTATLMTA